MKTQIKRFLLTLGFMTRIPVNVDLGEVKDEDMHKGFLYYPVVGLILGLCDMAVFLLVSLILPEVFGILFARCWQSYLTVHSFRWSFGYCRWNLFGENEREDA
ncbi:MAG: adenosylcobinamide-GDP ribazoletransferase [Anaerobutyricum soehngenii]